MQSTLTPRRRLAPRPVRPAGWWFDALLLAGFVALTAALAAGYLLDLDSAVERWSDSHRPAGAYWTARAVNFLGNGGPLTALCLLVALALGVRRRSVRPLFPVLTAFLLTGVVIMPLKLWTDRAAPGSPLPDRVELFNVLPVGEYAESYPSGHLVNTVVWYGVLTLLLAAWLRPVPRQWPTVARALRVAPVVLVFASTTYLGFHWVTDSVAGLLLGLLLDRLLARVPWDDLPLPALPAGWDRPAGL